MPSKGTGVTAKRQRNWFGNGRPAGKGVSGEQGGTGVWAMRGWMLWLVVGEGVKRLRCLQWFGVPAGEVNSVGVSKRRWARRCRERPVAEAEVPKGERRGFASLAPIISGSPAPSSGQQWFGSLSCAQVAIFDTGTLPEHLGVVYVPV